MCMTERRYSPTEQPQFAASDVNEQADPATPVTPSPEQSDDPPESGEAPVPSDDYEPL